jgi:hypothetical protein
MGFSQIDKNIDAETIHLGVGVASVPLDFLVYQRFALLFVLVEHLLLEEFALLQHADVQDRDKDHLMASALDSSSVFSLLPADEPK